MPSRDAEDIEDIEGLGVGRVSSGPHKGRIWRGAVPRKFWNFIPGNATFLYILCAVEQSQSVSVQLTDEHVAEV